MTSRDIKRTTLVGEILEDEVVLTLSELCRASQLSAERVIELAVKGMLPKNRIAGEGIVDPVGRSPETWTFTGVSLRRIRCAQRLQHDLGVNAAGVALALDLLEELEELRARPSRFEP